MNKAESYCFNSFLSALKMSVPNIYISNINSKKWMYKNYIDLGEMYGYDINIIELVCEDKNYLLYFRDRSKHNYSKNFCKKIFNEWDIDTKASLVEAYIGDYNGYPKGDSIKYPVKSIKKLDKELDDYWSDKCQIDSDNDEDSDSFDDDFCYDDTAIKLNIEDIEYMNNKRLIKIIKKKYFYQYFIGNMIRLIPNINKFNDYFF